MEDIKVGDMVNIKKSFPGGSVKTMLEKENTWPMRVTSVEDCDECDDREAECASCPGYVNGECYGYSQGYSLEVINFDWDE